MDVVGGNGEVEDGEGDAAGLIVCGTDAAPASPVVCACVGGGIGLSWAMTEVAGNGAATTAVTGDATDGVSPGTTDGTGAMAALSEGVTTFGFGATRLVAGTAAADGGVAPGVTDGTATLGTPGTDGLI